MTLEAIVDAAAVGFDLPMCPVGSSSELAGTNRHRCPGGKVAQSDQAVTIVPLTAL